MDETNREQIPALWQRRGKKSQMTEQKIPEKEKIRTADDHLPEARDDHLAGPSGQGEKLRDEDARKRVSELEAELSSLRAEKEKLEQKSRVERAGKEGRAKKETKAALPEEDPDQRGGPDGNEAQIDALKKENAELQYRLDMLSVHFSTVQQGADRWKETAENADARSDSSQKRIGRLKKDLEETEQQNTQLQQRLEEAERQSAERQQRLEKAEKQSAELQHHLDMYDAHWSTLQQDADRWQKKAEDADTQYKASRKQIKKMQKDLDETHRQNRIMSRSITELQKNLEETCQRNTTMSRSITELQENLEETHRQNKVLNRRFAQPQGDQSAEADSQQTSGSDERRKIRKLETELAISERGRKRTLVFLLLSLAVILALVLSLLSLQGMLPVPEGNTGLLGTRADEVLYPALPIQAGLLS